MSDMAEKLEHRAPSTQTPARRTLESLRKCHGFVVLQYAQDNQPTLVRVDAMEKTWAFRLVGGRGKEAMYEFMYERGGPDSE